MNFPFINHTAKNLDDQKDINLLVEVHPREYNTSEGGEFLDDAIRMNDQPLTSGQKNFIILEPGSKK